MKKALCTEIQSAFLLFSGGTSGGRTHDKRIKSPLLYQLSYGPFAALAVHCSKTQIIASFLGLLSPEAKKFKISDAAHMPKVAVTLTTEP